MRMHIGKIELQLSTYPAAVPQMLLALTALVAAVGASPTPQTALPNFVMVRLTPAAAPTMCAALRLLHLTAAVDRPPDSATDSRTLDRRRPRRS
jgi:hypothetical protein